MWQRNKLFLVMTIVVTATLQIACPDEVVGPPETSACPTPCFFPEECNPQTRLCEDPSRPADTGGDDGDTGALDVEDVTTEDVSDVLDVPEEILDTTELTEMTDGDVEEAEPDADIPDPGSEPEVDVIDVSDEEMSVSLDYLTCLRLEESLPEEVIVNWCWGEDEVEPIGTGENPDDPTGFDLFVDGDRYVRLGFGFARSTTVQGLTPGVTYDISVAPYLGTPGGIVSGTAMSRSVILPEPDELIVTPLQDLVLATDPLQSENLFVGLRYHTDDGDELVVLHADSRAPTSARASFTTVPEDTTVVEVSNKGVVKAGTIGSAEIQVTYSWSDVTYQTSLTVETHDATPMGILELTYMTDDGSDEFAVAPEFMLFPLPGAMKTQTVNRSSNYPLAPGRYFVPAPNFAFGESPSRDFAQVPFVFNISPGRTTAVTRLLVEVDACETVGLEAARIEASNGAFLDIPAGAVSDEMEICLTPLPAGAGPWRGMNDAVPLLLPESYLVSWPATAEVGPGVTLNVPLATDLADFMYDEVMGASETVGTLMFHHFATTPGPTAALAGEAGSDRLVVELKEGGIYQFEMCPATGENDGGCRVVYENCAPGDAVDVAEVEASACGDTAEFSAITPFEMIDTTDSSNVDMTGVFSAAVGISNRYDIIPRCDASPCGGDSCPETCRATTAAISCGRAYQGRVEQYLEGAGWQTAREFEIHVPQTTICGEQYEKCLDDAVCMPDAVPTCNVVCISGYER